MHVYMGPLPYILWLASFPRYIYERGVEKLYFEKQ